MVLKIKTMITFGFFILCTTIIATTGAISPALMLTPFIKTNHTEEARNLSIVKPSLFLNVTSYSGFLTVDEKLGSNMFFWFFPAMDIKSMAETPWIIWLQGGPGASGLDGLFNEMGPFENERNLKMRKWTWTKKYSVLFIDNPVGAGFSFTNSEKGFVRDMATCSDHLYSAINQFLTLFPELQRTPFYIAGESYAGQYVPALAMKILETNKKTLKNGSINLKGLMMGNPVFDRSSIQDYIALYYHWGLIDSQTAFALKPLQDAYKEQIKNKNISAAYDIRDKLLNKLEGISNQQQSYNVLEDNPDLEKFTALFDRLEIREAIHVGDLPFSFSNHSVHKWLVSNFLSDAQPKMETLLQNYRVMIYCGQLDLVAACVPNALPRRRSWNWSQRKAFLEAPRTPWWYNESVAGYAKSGGGLTEVLVRGAGHLVPMDKPAQAQLLIDYFIRGLDFETPPNYQIDFNGSPDLPLGFDVDFLIPGASKTQPKSSSNDGLIASIVINVVLVVGILVAALLFIRWKRRNEAFFYTTTDSITDGILSMS